MDAIDQTTADFTRIEGMFGDRNSFLAALPETERGSALAYVDGGGEPEKAEARRMKLANVQLLATTFKTTTDDAVDQYDRYQAAYASQVLQQPAVDLDPVAFHGLVKQRIDKRRASYGELNKLMDGLTEDYMADEKPDFDRAVSKRLAEREQAGAVLDGETKALFRDAAARRWSKMSESEMMTGEAIAAATDYFVKGRDVSYTGLSLQQQRAVDALGRLDAEDQRFAIARAASLAKTPQQKDGEAPGFLAKLNKLTGRSISEVARSAVGSAVELGVDVLRNSPAVQGEAGKTGKPVPTSEEVFARMEKEGLGAMSPRRMEIERKLAQALAGKADAVDTGGWASTSLLLAGSNLPRMAISLNPVGLAVNGVAYAKELEGELVDRGVAAGTAKTFGRIGAPIMAAIDFAQSGIAFKGWVPGGKGLVGKFASSMAKTAAVLGVQTVEQVGQEMTQDALAPVLQSIAALVDEQSPGINVMEEFGQLRENAPTTFLAMLPYVLVGTGVNRWKDRHSEKLFLAQRDYVQALGFDKNVQKAVMKAPDADAIAEIIQENWGNRDMTTPQALAAQAALGDKAKLIDLSDGGASLMTAQEIMEAEGVMPGEAAVDFRFSEQGVEVLDAGGTVIATAGNGHEAAMIALRYQKNEAALADANNFAESLNELPAETTVTVFPPSEVEGTDGFTREVPGSVQLDFYETDATTGEKVNTRSLTMEEARNEGFAVPAVPKNLAQGQYSVSDVKIAGTGKPPSAVTTGSTFASDQPFMKLTQAEIASMRATFPGFNMEELAKPERQKHVALLEAAKRPDASGVSMVDKSDALATALMLKPRAVSATEHAAFVVRMAQLRNLHESIMSDASQLFMRSDFAGAQVEVAKADAVAEQFESMSRAKNLANTEAGRALSALRIAVDLKTFDLVSLVNRMQTMSGQKLSPEMLTKLTALTEENKGLQEKIDALEARERQRNDEKIVDDAETFVTEAKEGRKPSEAGRSKKQKKAEKKEPTREELLAKLDELGFDRQNGGDLTPEVAHVIAQLGELHVREGAKTLSDIDGRMKEDVPALSEDEIHRAFAGKVENLTVPESEIKKRIKEFKKQGGLWADIHAILESGKVETDGKQPLASEKVKQLREILGKLRFNALKNVRDDAKIAELTQQFNEVQDQLREGYRLLPEGGEQRIEPASIVELRQQIQNMETLMGAQDSISELEDRLRRKAPPTTKRRKDESDALFEAHRRQRELRREVARMEESMRPKSVGYRLSEAGEFLRAAKATADFSAAFRQAVFLAPRRPVEFTKAFGKAAVAFFNSKYADRIDFEMRRQPQQIYRDRAGLYLSNVDGRMTGREESFTSTLIERFKPTGSISRASNRNMVVMLNLMRTAAFDSFLRSHPEATIETQNAMARFVNVATGRGELRGLEPAGKVLSRLAFSPRFVASRIQLLGSPIYFAAKDRTVAKEVMKDWAAFLITGMGVLTLAALAGADVGDDPEKHTFGKINFGPLVIDIWGGLQQPASLSLKVAAKTADTAGVYELDKDINIMDAGLRFLAYKASPGVTTPLTLMSGENIVGQEMEFSEAVVRSIMPMTLETMGEVWGQTEDVGWTLSAGAMSFVGMGVQVKKN